MPALPAKESLAAIAGRIAAILNESGLVVCRLASGATKSVYLFVKDQRGTGRRTLIRVSDHAPSKLRELELSRPNIHAGWHPKALAEKETIAAVLTRHGITMPDKKLESIIRGKRAKKENTSAPNKPAPKKPQRVFRKVFSRTTPAPDPYNGWSTPVTTTLPSELDRESALARAFSSGHSPDSYGNTR